MSIPTTATGGTTVLSSGGKKTNGMVRVISDDVSIELDRLLMSVGQEDLMEHHNQSLTMRRDTCDLAREKLKQLLSRPGIAQRTPEWYEAREGLITASDVAQALGDSKFGTQKQFFQKKCRSPDQRVPFDASCPPLKWGVMFEPVAQQIYSRLNLGIFVHEFGLLRHSTIEFLGASPDGITDLGVMVEIKCPWRRKILDKGTDGEAFVPTQYYHQIQAQLEVCDLDECDYFECEFTEVAEGPSSIDWSNVSDVGERGLLYELQQQKQQTISSSYVYAPLGASLDELRLWGDAVEASASSLGASAIIPHWWVLSKHQTVRVHRDREFVSDMIRNLNNVWDRVVSYRNDHESYLNDGMETSSTKKMPSSSSSKNNRSGCNEPYAFRSCPD